MEIERLNIKQFARYIHKIQGTDRWAFVGCDGDMGEGKSCFTSQLVEHTAKINKTHFTYQDNMTFKRDELKLWVDGDEKGQGQKQENSCILADELISMFFKRNWYDSEQIDGIELLNKCRDRHLLVAGNIPNFWDLDSAIYPIITFWVHIHERGRAWVFQKSRNPFATDKWYKKENEKIFNKKGNPYTCKGFLFEVLFDDWSPEQKKEYYEVRNTKRVGTEGQREKGGNVKYKQALIGNYNAARVMKDRYGETFDFIGEVQGVSKNTAKLRYEKGVLPSGIESQ